MLFQNRTDTSNSRRMTNFVTLRHECLDDLLQISRQYEDLTLLLHNGKFTCNSFLLATIFPAIFGSILETLPAIDEELIFSLPDFNIEEFGKFFSSIYHQESELEVSENIQYLMRFTPSLSVTKFYNDEDEENLYNKVTEDASLSDDEVTSLVPEIEIHNLEFSSDPISLSSVSGKLQFRTSVMARENDKHCQCGLTFTTKTEKADHYRLVHLGHHRCELCHRVTVSQNRHKCRPNMKRLTKEKEKTEIPCRKCDRIFSSYSSLFYHNHAEHGEAVTCELCGKVFQSRVHLKEHINRTHQEKTTCNVCGLVVKHMKLHMDNVHKSDELKRYRCEFCGKSFERADKIKRHRMSVHLKLQPFKCRYGCDMAYNDRSNRNQHERKKHGREKMSQAE